MENVTVEDIKTQYIIDAIRKDNDLEEDIKTQLYMFLGEMIGTKKAMDIIIKERK